MSELTFGFYNMLGIFCFGSQTSLYKVLYIKGKKNGVSVSDTQHLSSPQHLDESRDTWYFTFRDPIFLFKLRNRDVSLHLFGGGWGVEDNILTPHAIRKSESCINITTER
jgi:hypothetical protein